MKGGELTSSPREVVMACDVKEELAVTLQIMCEADLEVGNKG